MDHVIASGSEDSADAERLAVLLRGSGVPGRFTGLEIENEAELAEMLELDRDGASIHLLLVSRAFSARVESLAALDALFGALLLGRRRILVAVLPEERAPADELMRIVNRHDGISGESTLEGLARRIAGRLGRIHIHAQPSTRARRSTAPSPTLRRWLVGTIVVLIALLAWLCVRALGTR